MKFKVISSKDVGGGKFQAKIHVSQQISNCRHWLLTRSIYENDSDVFRKPRPFK